MMTTWMFSPRSEGSNITQTRGKQDDVSSRCHRDKCAEERGRMLGGGGGGGDSCLCVCVCVCVLAFCCTRAWTRPVVSQVVQLLWQAIWITKSLTD